MNEIHIKKHPTKFFAVMLVILLLMLLFQILVACSPQGGETANTKSSSSEVSQSQTLLTVDNATEMNKHTERGTTCASCHGKEEADSGEYQIPSADECLSCHNLEEVISATKSYDDTTVPLQNPHDSHVGTPRCSLCHSNHGESTLYCNECHMPDIEITVP